MPNAEWTHPHDLDTRVKKMKDGRTRLAYKADHPWRRYPALGKTAWRAGEMTEIAAVIPTFPQPRRRFSPDAQGDISIEASQRQLASLTKDF